MLYTVWAKVVQGILKAAANNNLEADILLSAVGLDASILQQINARISHEQLCALWHEITYRSEEEAIGLRLATCAQPATFDVINYSFESSPSLREALLRLGQYIRLIHDAAVVRLEVNGNVARLTYTLVGVSRLLPMAAYQWVMAHIVLSIRRITGLDFFPSKVGFHHPQPSNISAYHQLFRAPVEFAQPINEICFDVTLLEQSLLRSDPGLCVVLDRYATDMLAKLPQTESIIHCVRRELSVGSQSSNLKLGAIAQRLGMTPRTLQRKLKEVGTSHQALLDEVRYELSIYYLQEYQMAVCEVALLLGFSETSAFYRAFKRWTGKTPSKFRSCVAKKGCVVSMMSCKQE